MNFDKQSLLENMQVYRKPACRITGLGIEVPSRVVTNADIANMTDAPDRLKARLPSLIQRMTLVKERRYSDPHISPSDLGMLAVQKALNHAGVKVNEIDTLIFAATDTDQIEPATANTLQLKLGIEVVNSFDVSNACNSFLQAVNVSNSLIATGAAKKVCICAAELGSHWVNYNIQNKEDLRTKLGGLTLGDAAAAVILEPATGSSGFTEINLIGLGEFSELCHVPENIDWRLNDPKSIHGWFYLDMGGLAKIIRPLTLKYFTEYKKYRAEAHNEEDFSKLVDRVIPHQISRKLIEEIVESLRASMDLVAITADYYGNTASAAIPFTLSTMLESGKLKLGDGQDVIFFGAASGLGMGHIRLRL